MGRQPHYTGGVAKARYQMVTGMYHLPFCVNQMQLAISNATLVFESSWWRRNISHTVAAMQCRSTHRVVKPIGSYAKLQQRIQATRQACSFALCKLSFSAASCASTSCNIGGKVASALPGGKSCYRSTLLLTLLFFPSLTPQTLGKINA